MIMKIIKTTICDEIGMVDRKRHLDHKTEERRMR